MRIAIDARAWHWAGIGRYTRNLVRELLARDDEHEYVIFTGEKDIKKVEKFLGDFQAEGGRVGVVGVVRTRHQNGRSKIIAEAVAVDDAYYSWREQTVLRWQLQKIKADLFHFTHFNAPVHFNRPYVVTIHDSTRFVFPGQKSQSWLQQVAYEYVFSRVLAGAQAAITVSEATRRELLHLPLRVPSQLHTIPEGVEEVLRLTPSAIQQQKARMLLGFTEPYLLYVGVWMSHKNIARLLKAFAAASAEYPSLRLVMTGTPRPGYSQVLQWVRQHNLEDRVTFAGVIPGELLPAVYTGARALVFPSLYEGFGLPVLEAAALGTPVITSNVTSLPELLGEDAYYVNPEYTPDITRAILQTMGDEAAAKQLGLAGQQRAQRFNWKTVAQQHVAVYEQIGYS